MLSMLVNYYLSNSMFLFWDHDFIITGVTSQHGMSVKKLVYLILQYLTVFMRTVMSVVTRVDKWRILSI
jgi:hypothetical protein